MPNPLTSTGASTLGLFLARAPFGLYFAWAGYNKIANVGVRAFADGAAKHIPSWMPPEIGKTYLLCVPFVEVIVGLLLFFGIFARGAGFVALLMLISFSVAATGFWDKQLNLPHTNILLMGVAAMIVLCGSGGINLLHIFRKGASTGKKSA